MFFKRRVKARSGERVTANYDDDSRIDFNSLSDLIHHMHVQGVAGVKEVRREDGGLIYSRSELDKELAPRHG